MPVTLSLQRSEETLARKAQSISYKFKLFLIHVVNDMVSSFTRKDERINVAYTRQIVGFSYAGEVAVPFFMSSRTSFSVMVSCGGSVEAENLTLEGEITDANQV